MTTRFSSFDIDLRFLVVFLNCDVVHVIIVLITLQILEKILKPDLTLIHQPQPGLALDMFFARCSDFINECKALSNAFTAQRFNTLV